MTDKSLIPASHDLIGPDIRELAGLIKAMLPNGNKLTDQEALAGAMYGKAHGLNPFKGEYYIVPGRGIYPGYRGEMTLRNDREFYTQFRPMLGNEASEHDIQPGDSARICELYQPELMAHMRALGIAYRPILGVGIVRKGEKVGSVPPTGRSWAWKAEQRAYKDALRHMPGGSDVLDETVQDRLDEADERAEAITAEFTALPPDQQQARLAANAEAMRGPAEFQGFGDDDPPPNNGHDADAEFSQLPSASANQEQPVFDPTYAKSKDILIDWGLQQSAFEHPNHALNAWDVIKREQSPQTFADMRTLWIADVRRRAEIKRSQPALIDQEAPA